MTDNIEWKFAVGKSIKSRNPGTLYRVLAAVTTDDGTPYYILYGTNNIPFSQSKVPTETYFNQVLGPEDMFIVGKMYVATSGDTVLCLHVHEDYAFFERTYAGTGGHKTGYWTRSENRKYYSEMD